MCERVGIQENLNCIFFSPKQRDACYFTKRGWWSITQNVNPTLSISRLSGTRSVPTIDTCIQGEGCSMRFWSKRNIKDVVQQKERERKKVTRVRSDRVPFRITRRFEGHWSYFVKIKWESIKDNNGKKKDLLEKPHPTPTTDTHESNVPRTLLFFFLSNGL